jgi:hypothetical protein
VFITKRGDYSKEKATTKKATLTQEKKSDDSFKAI